MDEHRIFEWSMGLLLTAYGIALGFIYRVVTGRQDHTDARLDAFVAESLADRRQLATDQASLTTRQVDQYDRIMAELAELRSEIRAAGVAMVAAAAAAANRRE